MVVEWVDKCNSRRKESRLPKKRKGTHLKCRNDEHKELQLQLCLPLLDTWPFCYMCVVVLPCLTLNGAGEGEGVACCVSVVGATEEVGFQPRLEHGGPTR